MTDPLPEHDRRPGAAVVSSAGASMWFAGVRGRGAVECIDLATDGDRVTSGMWAVVGDFEGRVLAWRFADVERTAEEAPARGDDVPAAGRADAPWSGPAPEQWSSSMDRDTYVAGVGSIRSAVREGEVYQVNLCRVLSAPLPAVDGAEPDPAPLAARLAAGNPAPYAGVVHVPAGGGLPPVWVVTASPELFLRVGDGLITSGPIKGTATTPQGLTAKDEAENIMIADMVRNDLQRVCRPGTVEVTDLLAVEQHPGLVHLVTTVQGELTRPRPDWTAILAATYPPASVSGAPQHTALAAIAQLEPVARGPYCGAIGWIDADAGRAELAVGIRTFWWTPDGGGRLHFGTGAGITWGSDAGAEWAETELKAHRLVTLASTGVAARPSSGDDTGAPDGPDARRGTRMAGPGTRERRTS
ncbi:MAG TPA: chorismate-binding protein [Actinotalea sp.]|nr:chorismate-binding protein [Actinotalea sp.]